MADSSNARSSPITGEQVIHCLGWMPRPSLPPHQRHTNEPVPPRASARPPSLPPPPPFATNPSGRVFDSGRESFFDRLLLYIRIKNPYILDCRIIGRRRGFGDVSSSSWSISEGGREGERARDRGWPRMNRWKGWKEKGGRPKGGRTGGGAGRGEGRWSR